jgi:polysaccharide deacetylase family protein (PEP-CTERM system associated)
MPDAVTNALTIDFEDWYQGLEIPHTQWTGYEDRIVQVGRRLLQVFAEANARATFFILGYVAEQHPQLVKEIAAAGHEIGTHGYSHTLIYQQTPEVFREELLRSIRVLEDLTGASILGHRAPFFSITRKSLWALDILHEAGIRYDSSIFPVRNYRYGIEDAPKWPYDLETSGGPMREWPITTWQVAGKNLPVAGGAYFRIYPYALTRTAFRSINAQGRAALFYLHPWEIDPDHPRIPLPRRIALTHYFNLGATERRLRRLLRDFRFAPMKEVLSVS